MKRTFLSIFLLLTLLLLPFILPQPGFPEKLLKEAMYYEKLPDKIVQCKLCPRKCVIPNGKRGFCGVRENRGGILYTLVYAEPVTVNIDPIEKKPLFHFLPGAKAFSVATVGCNLKCKFCQNWQISQAKPEEVESLRITPQELVLKAIEVKAPVIAYTYSEPTIFYEYMLETAKIAKKSGIKNIMHSAGFINPEPLKELCQYLDAANIDLKGFTQKYYQEMCRGNLDNVLQSLKILKQQGVHLEITNLVLPELNDDPKTVEAMCVWIRDNLGSDTPLHFSRFWPLYKLTHLSPTPVSTLEKLRAVAMRAGLKYVYIGNVPGNPAETTYCPKCLRALIVRTGYTILENNLYKEGRCKFCKEKISGVWQ
jgi:pyruvate formate lyase activating enzyme